MSIPVLSSIIFQMLNCLLFQIFTFFLVKQQSWYRTPQEMWVAPPCTLRKLYFSCDLIKIYKLSPPSVAVTAMTPDSMTPAASTKPKPEPSISSPIMKTPPSSTFLPSSTWLSPLSLRKENPSDSRAIKTVRLRARKRDCCRHRICCFRFVSYFSPGIISHIYTNHSGPVSRAAFLQFFLSFCTYTLEQFPEELHT